MQIFEVASLYQWCHCETKEIRFYVYARNLDEFRTLNLSKWYFSPIYPPSFFELSLKLKSFYFLLWLVLKLNIQRKNIFSDPLRKTSQLWHWLIFGYTKHWMKRIFDNLICGIIRIFHIFIRIDAKLIFHLIEFS